MILGLIKRERLSIEGIEFLGKFRFFAVGGILVNNALGCGLVNHGGRRGQLLFGVGRVGGNSSIELTNGSTHAALHDAILQVFLLADLHAFLRGLDIRQLGSPPLRFLKKPSHGIISCLKGKSNPFRQKIFLFFFCPFGGRKQIKYMRFAKSPLPMKGLLVYNSFRF